MSAETVAEFCAVVASDRELQSQIKAAIGAGSDTVADFVAIASERGFEMSESDVLSAFTAERERRQQLEDDAYGETRIQRSEVDNVPPGIAGLRTVALSGDWRIGESGEESDNVLD